MCARSLLLVIFLITGVKAAGQLNDADTLDVVNWNLEYFAAGSPLNATTQVSGVRQMMNAIDADIYAVCEVVNVDSFMHLVQTISGNYDYKVSLFGSFANNPSSSGYASAQKLGIIYRTSMVRNVRARAMMSNSNSAYYNFSSGRYPYQVSTEVLGKDGQWHSVDFIILHAKALADNQSCMRRTDGCHELKDTLDTYFSNKRFLLLGDFNDDLDSSICNVGGPSNYEYMVQDSVYYKSITLPLSKAGAISIDGYTSLIDNVIASDEMYSYYVPGSAVSLRNMVKSIDPGYNNHVSDHFPVRTRYVLNGPTASIANSMEDGIGLQLFPNPTHDKLNMVFSDKGVRTYSLIGTDGKMVAFGNCNEARQTIDVAALPRGLYALILKDQGARLAIYKVSITR